MNKPPEKLMEGKPGQRIVYIGNGFLPSYEDFQRAFILEEQKPMTQKAENLFKEEAWIAMAKGECVKCGGFIQRIDRDYLEYWDDNKWVHTNAIGCGPYSIVPDPSKPKEVSEADEILIQFAEFVDEKVGGKYEPEDELNQADLTRLMLDFINSKFVRKP